MTTRVLDRRTRRMAVVGVLLYAAAASLTRPLTPVAAVAVLVPCVVALVLAGVRRTSWPGRVTWARVSRAAMAWGALVALAVVWEMVAWLRQPAYDVASADHPTLSLLLDPVTESPGWRFAVWCCWLYVGYRLVRR